jgi:hypothetical protein
MPRSLLRGNSLKSTTCKFFKYLAEEKGIYNEKVLGKPRR